MTWASDLRNETVKGFLAAAVDLVTAQGRKDFQYRNPDLSTAKIDGCIYVPVREFRPPGNLRMDEFVFPPAATDAGCIIGEILRYRYGVPLARLQSECAIAAVLFRDLGACADVGHVAQGIQAAQDIGLTWGHALTVGKAMAEHIEATPAWCPFEPSGLLPGLAARHRMAATVNELAPVKPDA